MNFIILLYFVFYTFLIILNFFFGGNLDLSMTKTQNLSLKNSYKTLQEKMWKVSSESY